MIRKNAVVKVWKWLEIKGFRRTWTLRQPFLYASKWGCAATPLPILTTAAEKVTTPSRKNDNSSRAKRQHPFGKTTTATGKIKMYGNSNNPSGADSFTVSTPGDGYLANLLYFLTNRLPNSTQHVFSITVFTYTPVEIRLRKFSQWNFAAFF